VHFRIAYDGEALRSHTMCVDDLAPALLSLSGLIKEANTIFNGGESSVKVSVTPNIEEKCFDIGLVVSENWGLVKSLLGNDDVVKAKDILEWTGIIFGVSVGPTLFGIYKLFKKRKVINIVEFKDENGRILFEYQLDSGEKEIVDQNTHKLYQSKKIRKYAKGVLSPVLSNPGIDEFRSYQKGKPNALSISKDEAKEMNFDREEEIEQEIEEDNIINALLSVRSPVYDQSAKRWKFYYGEEHHSMDVSESNIKDIVFRRGGVLIGDKFKVRLQIAQKQKEDGKITNDYKVLEVIKFYPAPSQGDILSDGKPKASPEEKED
jgi:hypothetical protein